MMMRSFSLLSLLISFATASEDSQFLALSNLQIVIEATYNGSNKPSGLSIRGNGLGLAWNISSRMNTSDGGLTWIKVINFLYCPVAAGFIAADGSGNNTREENRFRFGDFLNIKFLHMAENGTEMVMKGKKKIHRIKLHFSSPDRRTFRFWPHFFKDQGSTAILPITSKDAYIGTRQSLVYTPPGLTENPRPTYDVFFLADFGPSAADTLLSLMDSLTAADNAIVIGFGDYREDKVEEDRTNLLTMTPGHMLFCKSGNFSNMCDSCLKNWENMTESEYTKMMTTGGCGETRLVGGKAEQMLDHLILEVIPELNRFVSNETDGRSNVTADRNGTSVIGYSLGGLFACYAAWTRPEVFGGAACQSPSLWWPEFYSGNSSTSDFHFMNVTLFEQDGCSNSSRRNLPKLLIDVGELEEDAQKHMVLASEQLFDHITSQLAGNVFYKVHKGVSHSFGDWLQRIWIAFELLTKDRRV